METGHIANTSWKILSFRRGSKFASEWFQVGRGQVAGIPVVFDSWMLYSYIIQTNKLVNSWLVNTGYYFTLIFVMLCYISRNVLDQFSPSIVYKTTTVELTSER